MKVLSLFDGMACGAIAFTKMGIPIERYVAYEIDKYAAQVATHNFPFIEECGDVFKADFTEYSGFDWVIGGSPCTYWSIAQKNNRETEASGLGWELFSQYVRAVHEAKPKYFLYENNKSMSKEIRASIDKAFGFEAVGINSALVSAQNRQRLYWVGIRQEDGTYHKADIEQPGDRGILLRDVLDNAAAWQDKSYCLTATEYKGSNPWHTLDKHVRTMVAEPVGITDDGKSFALTTRCMGAIPEDPLTKHRHTMCAEPVNATADGKAQTLRATCYKDGIRNMVGNNVDRKTCVAEPVRIGDLPNDKGEISGSQATRIYAIDGKSVNLVANGGGQGAKTGLYAVPYEYIDYTPREKSHVVINENAIRCAQDKNNASAAESFVNFTDRKIGTVTTAHVPKCIEKAEKHPKAYPVYEVRNGLITIKDKQYPIKLQDGFYIIRKLTVSECKRLQTVPEWYDFSVISNSQAYKCLGNGWSVDVITHLIQSAMVATHERQTA